MSKKLGSGRPINGNTNDEESNSSSSQRRRQQFRNSDKMLALLTFIACISSATHIVFHTNSHSDDHPHHKSILKATLDNYVTTKRNGKDAFVRKQKFAGVEKKAILKERVGKVKSGVLEDKSMANTKTITKQDTTSEKDDSNTSKGMESSASDAVNADSKEKKTIANAEIDTDAYAKNAAKRVPDKKKTESITVTETDNKDTGTNAKGMKDGNVKNENNTVEKNTSSLKQKLFSFFNKSNDNGHEIKHDLHPVAHLNCADHGGPTDPHIIDEMVFWSDIPSDADYLSPMHPLNDPYTPDDTERFLTFEPDSGGWNNIRMAMETALVMSHSMGRTLVLPPEQKMYLLQNGKNSQKRDFGFNDFFHLDAISVEHKGFKVITMEEFLVREAMQGKMVEYGTNTTLFPPNNQTSWDSVQSRPLFNYLRKIGNTPHWEPWDCALAIPSSTEPEAVDELKTTLELIMDGSYGKPPPTLEEFNSNPTPVDAPMAERMREIIADKRGKDDEKLCLYDKPLQQTKLIHLKASDGARLLTHFYAFIFFADWRQDLWSKRFVRDHLRYVDDIMCAAARVVEAVREHARKNTNHKLSRDDGIYDALHVRRGDFQYPPTQLPAEELYELSKKELEQGSTLYIATDERDKSFFKPFKENYDAVFLDNFLDVIPGVNTNYYGMIDQLVAYKSRVFYGTWWSTLSGYVNRMRGYYIAKNRLEGYKDGSMDSYYFVPAERTKEMRQYIPVRFPIYCREFPISWRDIDKGIKEIANIIKQAFQR